MTDSPFDPPSFAEHLAALPPDLASTPEGEMTREEFARFQQHMAAVGEARGQCPTCWAYRLDGRVPERHVPGAACADQDGRPL